MGVQTSIEREKLLKVPLREWIATDVDVRSLEFAPGQQTGVHFHPCPVVGYIVEGAAILQVDGQVEQRLEKETAFHEPAGVKIARLDNASNEKPLHFCCDVFIEGRAAVD
jgi:quercetin dioxygenase-like cupin family protein